MLDTDKQYPLHSSSKFDTIWLTEGVNNGLKCMPCLPTFASIEVGQALIKMLDTAEHCALYSSRKFDTTWLTEDVNKEKLQAISAYFCNC